MFHVVFCILLLFIYTLSRSGSITSVGEERANLSAIFTCNDVVSVRRGFLFRWVLVMGFVILLWHYMSLPYNYCFRIFGPVSFYESHKQIIVSYFIILKNINHQNRY